MGRLHYPSALSILLVSNAFLWSRVSAQGTSLLGGQVTTLTDVQKFADLAQDVAEIQKFVDNDSKDRVETLFNQGQHAADDSGLLFSLASLGDTLANASPKTPAFLYHLYGLTDRSTNFAFELEAKTGYINKFITDIFEESLAFSIDAIISVSMWMSATHLLYDGVYRCHERTVANRANAVELGGAGFDEFIALWIGDGQSPGVANGDVLYAWAQFFGDIFGTNSPQAPTNAVILDLYGRAKSALSVENACSSDVPGTAAELWKYATQIVSEMSKPLFQGLIYSILTGDEDGVRIYGFALVPQIAKCRPSTYKRLKQTLLDGAFDFDEESVSMVLEDLQDAYACFGYTCDAIGEIEGDARLECDREKRNPPLAGYRPTTDVSAVARVDMDVLQIRILASLQADLFATYVYTYGTNVFKFNTNIGIGAIRYVSMHDISVSAERSSAEPTFDFFVEYFDEKDYADKLVAEVLSGDSKWDSTEQVAAIASMACAYMITFMEALAKLRIGVEDCRESDGDPLSYTLDPVDEAAALIVGSMGGPEIGGAEDREDGQLMYSLANKLAFQFNTANDDEYATVNQEILDLLLAARAEIDALDCDNLEISVDLLEKLLTVAIVQGAINAAIQNEGLSALSTATSIAEGELFSQAVLPYIKKHEGASATVIEENMIWETGRPPVSAGSSAVASAFGRGITYAIGLRCVFLGSTAGIDPCNGIPTSDGSGGAGTKSSAVTSSISMFAVLIAMFAVAATCL